MSTERKTSTSIQFPKAPRASGSTGFSHANLFCWRVAELAYSFAMKAHVPPPNRTHWRLLPPSQQDTWFWCAKAVMAALHETGD